MYYINIHTWTLGTIVMPLPVRRKQWPHGSHKTSDIGLYSTSFCPSGSFSWIPIEGWIYSWEDRNPMDEARLLGAWRKIFHTILMSDWCDNSLHIFFQSRTPLYIRVSRLKHLPHLIVILSTNLIVGVRAITSTTTWEGYIWLTICPIVHELNGGTKTKVNIQLQSSSRSVKVG